MVAEMRELVLGGKGLIGSELVRALEARGHSVVTLDLKNGHDLRRPLDQLPFADCDRVWFLAWDTGGAKYLEAEDQQHQQYKNNCELSLRIFDALARSSMMLRPAPRGSEPRARGRRGHRSARTLDK